MRTWFKIKAEAGASEATIYVYDEIGTYGVSAAAFVAELEKITAPTIHVRINSGGGDVFDSLAIFNALQRHPSHVVTWNDGLAASGASIVLIAGDEVKTAKNASLMIHGAWSIIAGDADDLRDAADVLQGITDTLGEMYVTRTGAALADVQTWMSEEKWFTAAEALALGFVDAIDGESAEAPETPPAAPAENALMQKVKALGLTSLLKPKPAASAAKPVPPPADPLAGNPLIDACTRKSTPNKLLTYSQLHKGHTYHDYARHLQK